MKNFIWEPFNLPLPLICEPSWKSLSWIGSFQVNGFSFQMTPNILLTYQLPIITILFGIKMFLPTLLKKGIKDLTIIICQRNEFFSMFYQIWISWTQSESAILSLLSCFHYTCNFLSCCYKINKVFFLLLFIKFSDLNVIWEIMSRLLRWVICNLMIYYKVWKIYKVVKLYHGLLESVAKLIPVHFLKCEFLSEWLELFLHKIHDWGEFVFIHVGQPSV